MKTEQLKKLLKPILSEADPRLHDKLKKGFYALRDWALEHPIIKEVEVTQFVKVPEVVKEIHHVETVEKIVEKFVNDPDQSKQIERLQKKIAKLEAGVKKVTHKCETSAAIAFLRFEIKKNGLTNTAFDAWVDDLIMLSLAECVCIANTSLSVLANASDPDLKVTLGVGKTAFCSAVMAWTTVYFPDCFPQSDRVVLEHIIQIRRPKQDKEGMPPSQESSHTDNGQHISWVRHWAEGWRD